MTSLGMLFVLALPVGVREVEATSCEVIRVNLAMGMTTQIVFEQSPTLTLHADEQHFKIRTNEDAERSIAIIPQVENSTISRLFPQGQEDAGPAIPSQQALAGRLDETLRTNLFVFFKNS